ncbi:MATE family efflux transporter [Brevibacillus sp. TJ4]|uniref:MATE family efflux transporter n=1 Tax=Brevibacillus sp. TJ4 TaxID=3234853 RepID=UPI0037D0E5B0
MSTIASVKQTDKKKAKELKLFPLTWPIFLELFLFMLMGSTDIFMLSAVSDHAVSGVGAANQFISIAILILEVIGTGAAIVVAQYIGSGKLAESSRIAAIAITLNLLVGIVISILFLCFSGPLLHAMNLQGDIHAYASTYLTIVGGSIFLQALINTLASVIRTHGYTRESMLISMGMNIVHVLANYVLIFGHYGFPELGVTGAAISTVFSRAVALLVFFWLLYRLLTVKIKFRDYFSFTKEYIRKILAIGVPAAFEQVTYQACQSVFLFYVTFLGAAELASRQYAMNISTYIYLFSLAIGMGTAIVTGRLVGANRKSEAYSRVWKSLRWGLILTLIVELFVILYRESLVGIFTDDLDIIRLTSQVILLSIFLESGRTFNLILINSLRAAGDAKFPVYMGLISMVGVSLPLGYFLVFTLDLGLAGVWLAIAADEWIRGIVMFFRWKSRAWESKSLVSPSE